MYINIHMLVLLWIEIVSSDTDGKKILQMFNLEIN